jgi:hypothetical protein
LVTFFLAEYSIFYTLLVKEELGMAIINEWPIGLSEADVGLFNVMTKMIWSQEKALLNHPLANFRQYTFIPSTPAGTVVRNLVVEYLNIPCSVPNLDDEVIAKSGGLILPTDRFMSVYDTNPNILSVVEWPAGSGKFFSIKRKEWNPASGRCEMLIRSAEILTGIIYRRVKAQTFSGNTWGVAETTEDVVITVNRSELTYEDELIFAGIVAVGDIMFWALQTSFVLAGPVPFIPSAFDMIRCWNQLGGEEVYRIIGTQLDPDNEFYRILARRFQET